MANKLDEIQKAIDNFQMEEARAMLRDELKDNPSADGYYLASQAAQNHGQRVNFLEKTIELDPFHQAAHDELASMVPPGMGTPPVATTTPGRKPKAKNLPNYQLASISKRLLALIIDSIILAVIGGVVGGLYGGLFGPDLPANGDFDAATLDAFMQFQMSAMMIGIVINAIYYAVMMKRTNGQTPGKQMMKVRVLKKDGTSFTYMDGIVRNVIGYWLSSIFILGYIWAIFDSNNEGWHDKIAGTIVVDES